jgi:hypothetical protein
MGGYNSLPALQVPQQQDILQKYGNLLALRNMQQQSQIQQQEAPLRMQALQQQTQSGQLQLQQQQQALKDQQSFRAAMSDPSNQGKTIGEIADVLGKQGNLSPATWQQLKKADIETRTSIAGLDEKQLANAKAAHDATQQLYNNVMNLPDDQLAANWPSIAQQYDAIPGNNKQPLNPNQPLTKAQLQQFGPLLSMNNAYLDQALARQQKTADLQATLAKPGQAAANAEETARHNAAMERNARARLSIEGARLDFETKKSGLTPDGTPNPLAHAIATGHIVPERMGYLLSRNPDLVQGVMAVDPTFDVSKAQAYPTTYKDFTNTAPTKAGGQILAAGTALQHLKKLDELNTTESHIPYTNAWTAYNNQAVTVAGELAKFYGENTDEGRASILKTLQTTLPGNRHSAITTQTHALGQRLDNFQQAWDNAAPSKAYQAPMPGISKQAMAARAALDPEYKIPSASMSSSAVPGNPPSGADVQVKGADGKMYWGNSKTKQVLGPVQ